MYRGTTLDGTLGNFYLKTMDDDGIVSYTKLIGVDSPSSFGVKDNKAIYSGTYEGIEYKLVLTVKHHTFKLMFYFTYFPKCCINSMNM